MTMNDKTKERLAELTPEFKAIVAALLQAGYLNGMSPQISCAFRSPDEQDELYTQGRAKPGRKITNSKRYQSLHNYRLAVDLFFLRDGKATFLEDDYRTLWNLACKAKLDAKGLQWSGNWSGSFKETAHWQLGKQDWRELCVANGIDPITLNKKKVQNV